MARLELPNPFAASALPFQDVQGARAWLKTQPQAEPMQMQTALLSAVRALDASDLAAPVRVAILDALRNAVLLAQSGLEVRYTRKPLPMSTADSYCFATTVALWRALAVAYLRPVFLLPPAEALVPLHRGVMALRLEQYAHFLCAHEVPDDLLKLLYSVLTTAESLGLQRTPLADPEYKHMGESHIAGHVAWAFLLQFSDPFRLSVAQLTVVNRAFSRWRELAGFQSEPGTDPKARTLALQDILGADGIVEGGPNWLDVRPVVRKLRKRVESMEAGESPESLKLGRELSLMACIRLLHQIDRTLRPAKARRGGISGTIDLVFGAENCYLALTGRELNRTSVLDPGSRGIAHQRVAIFGFDDVSNRADAAVKRIEVPAENWQIEGDEVMRGTHTGGRLLSPCLIATPGAGKGARLGVLHALRITRDGGLRARVTWYEQKVEAAWFKGESAATRDQKVPAFVIPDDEGLSVILPANAGTKLGGRVMLEDSGVRLVALTSVLERGSDFLRYTLDQQ